MILEKKNPKRVVPMYFELVVTMSGAYEFSFDIFLNSVL